MKIDKPWHFTDDQTITIKGRVYNVHAAIMLSKSIQTKKLPIDDFNIDYLSPANDSFRSFVEHVKLVNEADLKYPIILNQDGAIIDGKHRLAKAILLGKKTIKTKRFIKDPSACFKYE